MAIINSKTIARIAAVQVVYQLTMNESISNIDKIMNQVIGYYEKKEIFEDLELRDFSLKMKLHKNFFNDLCQALKTNLAHIDEVIKTHLSGEWPFENLHMNLKAIMRCGVAELLYFPEIPSKVIINEYTSIGSDMLKTSEVGFTNSVLDTINKEIRKDAP